MTRPLSAALQAHLSSTVGEVTQDCLTAPRKVTVTLTVACAAVTVLSLAGRPLDLQHLGLAVLLATVTAICEVLINEPFRAARRDAMHPWYAFLAAALIWHPGPWIVLGVMLAAAVTHAWRGSGALTAAWVTARTGALGALGLWVTLEIDVPILDGATGALVTLAGALILTALADPEGRARVDVVRMWARAGLNAWLLLSFGTMAAFLLERHLLWAIALTPAAVAIAREYASHRAEIAEADLLASLIAYARARDEVGVLPAAELTVFAMETVFASRRTEVTLTVLDPDRPWQLARTPDSAYTGAAPATLTTATRELLALGSGTVTVSTASDGATFTAVLGDPDLPLALVDVRWSGTPARHRAQRERLGRQVAVMAGTWLSNAYATQRAERAEDRAQSASGDVAALVRLSDRTRPALDSLREATRQVSVLSQSAQTAEVSAIVGELDRAAAAVATLLGAVTAVADGPGDTVEIEPVHILGAVQTRPEGAPASVPFGHLEVARDDLR